MSDKAPQGLDLDALEAEADEIRPPFTFTLDERQWTTRDPKVVDWRDIAAFDDDDASDPREILRIYLDADAYAEFAQINDVPKWKISRLLNAITEHYTGVSPGESAASSAS